MLGLPAAVAAGIVFALFAIQPAGKAQARPAEVVALARGAHEAPIDHHYLLRTEGSVARRGPLAGIDFSRDVDLWTRGDRFRIEPGPTGTGSWGRDEHGDVWLAFSPKAGVRFDAGEVPVALSDFLTVRSVDLPSLLSEVLRRTELERQPGSPGIDRIEATPPPGARRTLLRAVLDIDRETYLVKRLELHRRIVGAAVVVTLTHLDSISRPADSYRLKGQLAPGADIGDRGRPARRLQLLVRHKLGALLGKTP